ncbi:MAG: hypothetical protein WCG02_02550 [Candidatus Taylorbacteria bacterium]
MSNNVSSDYRGKASEALGRQAFEALMERKLRGNIPRIIEVFQPDQNSIDDQMSIDLLLKFHTATERKIQIKSSEWGRRRYLFQCARRGIDPLPCLVVNWKDELKTVIKRALRLLKIMFMPVKANARKLVREFHQEFENDWEAKLEVKWWRRRKRRTPQRVRMAFAY